MGALAGIAEVNYGGLGFQEKQYSMLYWYGWLYSMQRALEKGPPVTFSNAQVMCNSRNNFSRSVIDRGIGFQVLKLLRLSVEERSTGTVFCKEEQKNKKRTSVSLQALGQW